MSTVIEDQKRIENGQYTHKAQGFPESFLLESYPASAVTLNDAQDGALQQFEAGWGLTTAGSPHLRPGLNGGVTATYEDKNVGPGALSEITLDEDGAVLDFRTVSSWRGDGWVNEPLDYGLGLEQFRPDRRNRSVNPTAAQSAVIDILAASPGFTAAAGRGERGVVSVLITSDDGLRTLHVSLDDTGAVTDATELVENADEDIVWQELSPAKAKRLAKKGITS